MNSAMYVMVKKTIVSNSQQETSFHACTYNQKSNTKNSCTCELLVCKFQAFNFFASFWQFWCGGFQVRFIYREFQSRKIMSEVAKLLQGFVMWKLQGNEGFWKAKQSKCSFVTDCFAFFFFFFFFCGFISHLIGGYTSDMSKSNQSVLKYGMFNINAFS